MGKKAIIIWWGEPCGILRLPHDLCRNPASCSFCSWLYFCLTSWPDEQQWCFFLFSVWADIHSFSPRQTLTPEHESRRHTGGDSEEGRGVRDGTKKDTSWTKRITFRKQVTTWKTLTSCPEYLNQLSWDALWGKGSECPLGLGRLESLWECSGPGVPAYFCGARPTERRAYLEHFGSLSISMRKQQIGGRKHLEWVLSHSEEK